MDNLNRLESVTDTWIELLDSIIREGRSTPIMCHVPDSRHMLSMATHNLTDAIGNYRTPQEAIGLELACDKILPWLGSLCPESHIVVNAVFLDHALQFDNSDRAISTAYINDLMRSALEGQKRYKIEGKNYRPSAAGPIFALISKRFDDIDSSLLVDVFSESRRLSDEFKYATAFLKRHDFHPKSAFRKYGANQSRPVIYNQALVALFHSAFEGEIDGYEVEDFIHKESNQNDEATMLDELMSRISRLSEIDATCEARQADLIVLSGMVNLFSHVAEREVDPKRSAALSKAVCDLVSITMPDSTLAVKKTVNLFSEPSTKKWLKGDQWVIVDLVQSISKSKTAGLTDEARLAVSQFHADILLHACEAKVTLEKYSGIQIMPLVVGVLPKKADEALVQPKALNRLSPTLRRELIIAIEDPALRSTLMQQYKGTSKAALENDLGL